MIGGVRVTTSYIASLHDTCVLITKTLKIFFYSSSGAPTTTLLAHANESSPIIQNRPNPAVAPCDRRWMWCQLRAQVNRVGIQRVRIEGERRRDLRTRYRLRKAFHLPSPRARSGSSPGASCAPAPRGTWTWERTSRRSRASWGYFLVATGRVGSNDERPLDRRTNSTLRRFFQVPKSPSFQPFDELPTVTGVAITSSVGMEFDRGKPLPLVARILVSFQSPNTFHRVPMARVFGAVAWTVSGVLRRIPERHWSIF